MGRERSGRACIRRHYRALTWREGGRWQLTQKQHVVTDPLGDNERLLLFSCYHLIMSVLVLLQCFWFSFQGLLCWRLYRYTQVHERICSKLFISNSRTLNLKPFKRWKGSKTLRYLEWRFESGRRSVSGSQKIYLVPAPWIIDISRF